MKKILLTILSVLILAAPAWALDLSQAKSQGLVGETPSGYLEAVKPSDDVNALVKDINSKRKTKYQKIAKKNGTELAAVEALAGNKAMSKTPAGQYVKQSGKWVKK